jgi:hypothetical protein
MHQTTLVTPVVQLATCNSRQVYQQEITRLTKSATSSFRRIRAMSKVRPPARPPAARPFARPFAPPSPPRRPPARPHARTPLNQYVNPRLNRSIARPQAGDLLASSIAGGTPLTLRCTRTRAREI